MPVVSINGQGPLQLTGTVDAAGEHKVFGRAKINVVRWKGVSRVEKVPPHHRQGVVFIMFDHIPARASISGAFR